MLYFVSACPAQPGISPGKLRCCCAFAVQVRHGRVWSLLAEDQIKRTSACAASFANKSCNVQMPHRFRGRCGMGENEDQTGMGRRGRPMPED